MKRFLVFMMVLMALVWSAPSEAAFQDFSATVYRWSGGYAADGSPTLVKATTGITYRVLAAGADTNETLYAFGDDTFTSKTNAVSATVFATDGRIAFRTDPTDASYDRYVDLIVVDQNGGYTTVVKNFDKYTHVVIIDERPNILHHGILLFDGTTDSSVESAVLSKHTFLSAMVPEVLSAITSVGYSVGISGSSSLFRYGSMSVVGYSSHAANVPNLQVAATLAATSVTYFTTATTSVYITKHNTLPAGTYSTYRGNIHYWFTVVR